MLPSWLLESDGRGWADCRECAKTAQTCGGKGNVTCFRPQWARGMQIIFCPFDRPPAQPSFGYMSTPAFNSRTPVLYTSDGGMPRPGAASDQSVQPEVQSVSDRQRIDRVVQRLFFLEQRRNGTDDGAAKLRGAMDFATSSLFQLMVAAPLAGCASIDGTSVMSESQQAAVCRLLQYGQVRDPSDSARAV